MADRKKVGIFSLTCDEGCSIYLIEIFNKKLIGWLDKIELEYFLSVKPHKEVPYLDIALIEGVVSNEEEKKKLLHIRDISKVLIAMGNCATNAAISGQRNNFSPRLQLEIQDHLQKFNMLPRCYPLKELVKVDDQIPGCPIIEENFIKIFEKYL